MPEYPIKLGRKMNGMMPHPMESEMEGESPEHYPSLYLEWDEDYGLPDSGTMTVRFKKCCETNTTSRKGTKQSVTLDVTEIVSVKSDGKAKEPSGEDELDRLKKEVESEESEESEEYKEEED